MQRFLDRADDGLVSASPAIAGDHVERDRLRAHFEWVLAVLDVQDTSSWPVERVEARRRTLDALARYAEDGVFPRNFLGRMHPTFVDHGHAVCGVAHLMLEWGRRDLVDAIASTDNFAHVAEMITDDALAWFDQAGITAAEAAFLQPEYCGIQEQCITKSVEPGCPPEEFPCACVSNAWANGTPCFLYGGDRCEAGACQGGQCTATGEDLVCKAYDSAHLAFCDEERGCVTVVNPFHPTGSPPSVPDEGGCSTAAGLPGSTLAPVFAMVFLAAIARRRRERRP